MPLGAVAKIRRGPVPVIRHSHFNGYCCETSPSKTAAGGLAEAPKPKTHNWPLLVVPRISGQPVGAYVETVEGGEQVSGDALAWSGAPPPTSATTAVAKAASANRIAGILRD